ncbi:hypothetical protein DNO_1168 [Dichelobacter nodosus VCS1703A]|uniref:Uncharacterized protein n=1 Tax=Dichelobacter nodosus (strain VCS1703A) TaxID=246195 RepID=A5EXI4_DICNV|nr:hypothetical protein DNO_1168 [Dichelobacter nodosus VCS1703A]
MRVLFKGFTAPVVRFIWAERCAADAVIFDKK